MGGALLWGTLLDAAQGMHFQYTVLLVAFFTFVVFVSLQIITGVFVSEVWKVVQLEEEETFVRDEFKKKERYVARAKRLFHRLDLNENGSLCRDELSHAFRDDHSTALLTSMKLDVTEAQKLFDLLD